MNTRNVGSGKNAMMERLIQINKDVGSFRLTYEPLTEQEDRIGRATYRIYGIDIRYCGKKKL